MWALLAQISSKTLGLFIPWVGRFLFGSMVKKAGKGVLKKAPLGFYSPNLLVTGVSVLAINGLNFFVMLFLTDSKWLSLISAASVTAVTAFFLLRGFFCEHTRRERTALLIALLVFFGLFVFFLFYLDIVWLALVAKLTLEVILCFAVMLAEINRMNRTQAKVVVTIMRKLRISPRKPVGRFVLWIGGYPRIKNDIITEGE